MESKDWWVERRKNAREYCLIRSGGGVDLGGLDGGSSAGAVAVDNFDDVAGRGGDEACINLTDAFADERKGVRFGHVLEPLFVQDGLNEEAAVAVAGGVHTMKHSKVVEPEEGGGIGVMVEAGDEHVAQEGTSAKCVGELRACEVADGMGVE